MKRILTIDGGGLKGVFPAKFLAEIEEEIGDSVSNYFDLICGTSTGGLISLALGLGIEAKEILSLYEKYASIIFPEKPWYKKLLNFTFSKGQSLHNNIGLEDLTSELFQDYKLEDSKVRLVIPAMCSASGQSRLFKTRHHTDYVQDYKIRMKDIAMATSAAPLYLPNFRFGCGEVYLDGGVWANNPMLIAVLEAIYKLDWTNTPITMLSVGCTEEPFKFDGIKKDLQHCAKIFMAPQSSFSMGTSKLILGKENVHRITTYVPNGRHGLDSTKNLNELKARASRRFAEEWQTIKPVFFNQKAEKFIPLKPEKEMALVP